MESNRSCINHLEAVQRRMDKMTTEETSKLRLDDTLGGDSQILQIKAIQRLARFSLISVSFSLYSFTILFSNKHVALSYPFCTVLSLYMFTSPPHTSLLFITIPTLIPFLPFPPPSSSHPPPLSTSHHHPHRFIATVWKNKFSDLRLLLNHTSPHPTPSPTPPPQNLRRQIIRHHRRPQA